MCYLEEFYAEGSKYPYGLKIESSGAIRDYYFSSPEPIQTMMSTLNRWCILRNFEENYSLLDKLGSGNFGKVNLRPASSNQPLSLSGLQSGSPKDEADVRGEGFFEN